MNKDTIAIIEYRDKALQQLQTVSELTERAQSLAEEDKNGADAVCLLLARQTRQSVNNAISAIHKMLHYAAKANYSGEDLYMFHEQEQKEDINEEEARQKENVPTPFPWQEYQ